MNNFIQAKNLSSITGIGHGFFNRHHGTVSYKYDDDKSHVDENRLGIAKILKIDPKKLYTLTQTHSTEIIRIKTHDDPQIILHTKADALWTTDHSLALGIETADCAPVLFTSSDGQVVGAIHAGWRGAVTGIVMKTIVQVSLELKLATKDFILAVGPCISFDALEVGPEVIDLVDDFRNNKQIIKSGQGDRFYLNLFGLISQQAQQLGIDSCENINQCTKSNPDKYFSYRAQPQQRANQLSVIARVK